MNELSDLPAVGPAFLVSQLGYYAAAAFGRGLRQLHLEPRHVGVLRLVVRSGGMVQGDLVRRLHVLPSRLVLLLDELEGLGLVERRTDPADRRRNIVVPTEAGRARMQSVAKVSDDLDEQLLAALPTAERSAFIATAQRLAAAHGLLPGVHPSYQEDTDA